MKTGLRLVWLVGLLCGTVLLTADDKPSGPADNKPAPDKPVKGPQEFSSYIKAEKTVSQSEPPLTVCEQVVAYLPDRTITADYLIGWGKPMQDRFPYDEIYCEGNIEITMAKDVIRAKQVYYNLKNGQGIIKDIEWRTVWVDESGNVPKEGVPLVIRASELIQESPTTFKAHHASVTTCPHGSPHYDFWVGTVIFTQDAEGKRISLYHVVPRISGIPVFYLPYYYKVLGDDPLVRSVQVEDNSRFGFTTTAKIGFNINKFKQDEKGERLKDKNGFYIPKRWGDFTLESAFYRKRGLGWEPELQYHWNNYEGKVLGYYIHDKGPDPNNPYDRQFLPMETPDRGRLLLVNRYNNFLITGLRFDTEMSYLSDRNFLLEYFENEAREGKGQETYGYLRWTGENKSVTFLERFRLNDFQTQTEYLPQMSGKIIKEEINLGVPVYFSSFTEAANLRRRFDDDLHTSDMPRLARFDTLEELSVPFHLSVFNFSPVLSGRFTSYEKGLNTDNSIDRFIASGGMRCFTQFYRTFDKQYPSLGIDKIRHLISLDARYNNNMEVTRKPTEIIQYDSIDQLDRFNECYFELRNRFQTKSGDTYFEFLNIGLAAEYYPNARRDTTKENPANYLYPMSWITLAPINPASAVPVFPERHISNLNLDLNFTPRGIFSVNMNNEYNTYLDRSEVFNASFNVTPFPGWTAALSERYLRDIANAAGLSLGFSPIEKWWVTVAEQYDFRANRFTNVNYTFRRDLHELFLDFIISVDKGTHTTLFNFTISPKGILEQKSFNISIR